MLNVSEQGQIVLNMIFFISLFTGVTYFTESVCVCVREREREINEQRLSVLNTNFYVCLFGNVNIYNQ